MHQPTPDHHNKGPKASSFLPTLTTNQNTLLSEHILEDFEEDDEVGATELHRKRSNLKGYEMCRGKNKQRHLACLRSQCKFRQTSDSKSTRKEQTPALNFSERNRKNWEEKVFSQLSRETKLFIQDRFDARNGGKEKHNGEIGERKIPDLNNRNDIIRKHHRLFNLQCTDIQQPGIVAYI